MPKSLYNTLIERKDYLKSITDDHVLDLFDSEKCKEIDIRSLNKSEQFVRSKHRKCIRDLEQCKVDHDDYLRGAFDVYNEIVIYDLLKEKCNVKPLIESNKTSRPDFIVTTKSGHEVNIDLKTFHFNGGTYNYRNLQNQHTRSKIAIEKHFNGEEYDERDLTIYTLPFRKPDKYTTANRKDVIESFINKTEEAYKQKQLSFNNNPGILLVDTKVLRFPVFMQEALPYFLYPPCNTVMSGALWHACFGKSGERTFDYVESNGAVNIGHSLEKNGVLWGSGSLKAIVFVVYSGGSTKLMGFHRSGPIEKGILECLGELCDFINDEWNAHPFKHMPVSALPVGMDT